MNDQTGNRKIYILLTLFLLLGAFLRFYKLDFQSLWYDELHSVVPTAPDSTFASIVEYAKSDQPPFYFIYQNLVFKLLGYNPWIARAGSAFLGLLSIPVFFFLGRELKNERVGIAASLLVTVSYFNIYYSQEARFYTMAFLFSALSYLFFVRCYKNGSAVDYLFYIVSTTLLLYTHYFALVIYATQAITFVVIAIWYRWGDWQYILSATIAGVVTGLCFLPWMPVILNDLGIGSFWIQKPKPTFILEYFYGYVGKDALASAIFLGFTALFLHAFFRKRYSPSAKPVYLIVILWLLISYLIPLMYSLLRTPILHIRYTIITLPAWILIFALGWNEITSRKWRYSLLAVVGLSPVVNIFFVRKHYDKIQKQQFREASYIVQQSPHNDAPVYSNYAWHYNFYFRHAGNSVRAFRDLNLDETPAFWILQAQFFSDQEEVDELAPFRDQFEIAERHSFHHTDAVYLVRKSK